MKHKIIFIAILSLFSFYTGSAQQGGDSTTNRLPPLHKHNDPQRYYVNFDFIKISLPGLNSGWVQNNHSVGDNIANNYAPGFNLQLYYPYALFHKQRWWIHFAWGISIGDNAIDWRYTKITFTGNNTGIVADNGSVNKQLLKVGYIGANFMPFAHIGKRFEIMSGPSFQANLLGRKLVTKADDGKEKLYHIQDVNLFSLPIITQLDYKFEWTRVLFLGIYYSYDMQPRFKDQDNNDIKQRAVGINFGINL